MARQGLQEEQEAEEGELTEMDKDDNDGGLVFPSRLCTPVVRGDSV